MCCVPVRIAGGNPFTDVPGLSPRSPDIVVAPVLVTAEPARIAKFEDPASGTEACTVVCIGISIGFTLSSSSSLQPLNATTETNANAENNFIAFILFALHCECIIATEQR
jgi:hypothetical protein